MKTIKPFVVSVALTCMMFIAFGNRNAGNRPSSTISMPGMDKKITGVWKAVSSSGGFTGKGFTLDFDYLILKDNGAFELKRNDAIIAQGKVTMAKEKKMILSNFIFENTANVQLSIDPEKYLQFSHTDTLNLVAPCCDRYNIKLARKR
ncbi:MAG TPA: hypothetical protein VFG54_11505 [Prolixibacteraceae bacterium]|nr:hypothetical protein [Prolixibacteraceae bacterium]